MFYTEQAEQPELILFINNLHFELSGTVPEHSEHQNRNTGTKGKKKAPANSRGCCCSLNFTQLNGVFFDDPFSFH